MSDPFSADIAITNKEGLPTSYMEDYMYQVTHIEEGSPLSNDPGEPGEMRRDSDYFYVCYDTSAWGRLLLQKGY